jgi:hypothetical protein
VAIPEIEGTEPLDLASLRVLIVHDWIVAWGGAERTLEQMFEIFPDADLVVGVLGEGRSPYNAVTRRARESWLARVPFARTTAGFSRSIRWRSRRSGRAAMIW